MPTSATPLGLIILPDDSRNLSATFADDHYLPDLRNEEIKVVAQLPAWVDIRWYQDLARRTGHEVKSGWVVRNWATLSLDLRDSAERCIREALITISDSTVHRLELQAQIENRVTKRRLSSLPQLAREHMQALIDEHVDLEVLFESPAYDAMRYVGGADPDVRELRRKLGNSHNVRIFSARASAAFAEYLDRELRADAIQMMIDKRYFFPSELTELFMVPALGPHRTFDEGNSKVFNLISDIREGVADRIRRGERLILPADSAGASEADSRSSPHIAASDIASRIAGDLYRSEEGLRNIVNRFTMVILNGSVVKRF